MSKRRGGARAGRVRVRDSAYGLKPAKTGPQVHSQIQAVLDDGKAHGLEISRSILARGQFHVNTKTKNLYGPTTYTRCLAWLRRRLELDLNADGSIRTFPTI